MTHRPSSWSIAVPVGWLLLGCLASLPWLGIQSSLAYGPLMLSATPFWAIDTRFGALHVSEGLFWTSGHSPPFLKPAGIALVYFAPAVIGILCYVRIRANGPCRT